MHIEDYEKVGKLRDAAERVVSNINGIKKVMSAKQDKARYVQLSFSSDHIQKALITIDDSHLDMYCRMTVAKLENKLAEIEFELNRMGVLTHDREEKS